MAHPRKGGAPAPVVPTNSTSVAELVPGTPEQQAMRRLKLASIDQLLQFFQQPDKGRDAIAVARVAAASLSSSTRDEQTNNARRTLDWNMARDLARDKEQLEAYVRVSMPTAPIVRALPQLGPSERKEVQKK